MYKIFERLCKERGITPYRVCKDTGLTTSTISNWKAGRYEPKADKIKILADYFGVSPEFLRTGHEPEKKDYYLNEETAEMVERLYKNENLVYILLIFLYFLI